MVRWHHRLNGCEFGQTPGYSKGQGSLVCYSPWGCKELDMTERLKNSNKWFCNPSIPLPPHLLNNHILSITLVYDGITVAF